MSWRTWGRRGARDEERAQEIDAHIALATQHYIDRGLTPEEARRAARMKFGNPRAHQERVDDLHRLPLLDALGGDLRYALRVLRRSPGFTFTAIATLAIVIGANSAVFSVADHLLLRPLPYPEPGRLYLVQTETSSAHGRNTDRAASGATYFAIRDAVPSVDAAVYAEGSRGAVNLNVGDRAEAVTQQRVGTAFFRVLGVPLALGREFSADEDRPNGPAAVILSDRLWQRLFHADPQAIGRTLLLRGEAVTVVGVTRPDFIPPSDVDLWTPLRASTTGEGANPNFQVMMRLRDGRSASQMDNELLAAGALAFTGVSLGGDITGEWLTAAPLKDDAVAATRTPVLILSAAVTVVLVIACVNIASLLLARGSTRRKELATRMALGSGRALVIRQLMVESLVLALVGGALGLLVGAGVLEGLKHLAGDTLGDWSRVAIDARVVAWTIGVSVGTSVLFGLVPAWQASRIDVQRGLTDGGSRAVAGGASHWLRRALVVTQVALGVVLLVCAGLLIRTFEGLTHLDAGIDGSRVVTAAVSLQDARYQSADRINYLFSQSLDRLRQTPGVVSAAVTLELPYARLLNMGFKLDGDVSSRLVNLSYATAGFTETLGVRLLDGRALADTDRADTAPVVLVNDTFARLYSPDRSVIGRMVRVAGADRQIVGVVKSTQQRQSFSTDGVVAGPITALPGMFVPASQGSDGFFKLVHTWFQPVWSVRTAPGVDAGAAIRAAIHAADPQLPVLRVQTLDQLKGQALAEQRLLMTLVGMVAAAALLLSAMGLHGLIAHSVAERRREFGIRLGLGASRAETIRRVAASGLVLAAIGAAAGAVASIGATRLIASMLWGVAPGDPATYAGVMAFLLVVAAASSLLPAAKLLRLDPAATLRE